MKVLVTGGAGFIGRNILKTCSSKGWETVSIDLSENASADVSLRGSVEDFELMLKATKNIDYVFHEAAVTSPPQFELDGIESFHVNVIGTLNLLQAANLNGVKRVILASSSSVYGDLRAPGREDSDLPSYQNLYPLSKSVNEQTASYFSSRGELETICLRYFNTYGYGENSKGAYSSVISKFIEDLANSKNPVIFGDGSQRRDFVFVEDVANANLLAAEKGRSGQCYNIGTGVSTTFNDIYEVVRSEMESELKAKYEPVPFTSYQMFTQADIGKSEKELGFRAKYAIRDGVRKMLTKT